MCVLPVYTQPLSVCQVPVFVSDPSSGGRVKIQGELSVA